jgi:hypothetical protein
MLDGGIDCGRDDAEGACREECHWEPLATVEPIAVETTEKRGAVGSPIGDRVESLGAVLRTRCLCHELRSPRLQGWAEF